MSGKPDQYDDLTSFVGEHDLFRQLVAESSLPWHEFDITHHDVGRVAGEVAD